MSNNDPWFWSVDEVVTQLCRSFALFVAAAQSAADIPDCPALETELRMQNITGKALLTKCNTDRLVVSNTLRISHLSQRLALLAVIGLLQRRSHAYQHFLASSASGEPIDVTITRGPCNSTTRARNDITEALPTVQSQVWTENDSNKMLRQVPQIQRMPCIPGEPDEFEHLLRWQDTAESDEIINFGLDDSPEDDEQAEWADTIEADDDLDSGENEELPKRPKLSDAEIFDIVDERINFYMDSWRPNAGVAPGEEVDYDVNAMWDEAEASGQRQNLAERYEAEYAYFKRRLDAMREEINKFPGNNADQIRQQCRNLEVTIESMELAGWLRDIYSLEPVADSDDELANSDDELANHSDDAVRDAWPPKSHAVTVADTEIVDLDLLPGPSEGEKSTLDTNRLAPGAPYLFGIPTKHQPQNSTPKLRIDHSIEPTVDTYQQSQNAKRIISNYGDEPENASISSVRRWNWHELIEHLDRKRIVSKAMFEMDVSDLEAIRIRVRLMKKSSLLREITACINMLKRGQSQLQGILPKDMRKIINFTTLFLSWWFCKNYFKEPDASLGDLEELQSCIEDGSAGTTTFYDYLCTIMQTTFSEQALQHPEQPSQAEIIEISDDD